MSKGWERFNTSSVRARQSWKTLTGKGSSWIPLFCFPPWSAQGGQFYRILGASQFLSLLAQLRDSFRLIQSDPNSPVQTK